MPIIECLECHEEFHIPPSWLGRIFCCSKKCSNTRKKFTMQGENNPFYGKKHSKETVEINRMAHKGKPSWNKGRVGIYSKETIKKMRLAGRKRIGEKHSCWKGGRRNRKGYIAIYSPHHPFRDKNKCVLEHRLVMEKKLNRYLRKSDTIHHINGVKSDNRVENLILFSSNREHLLHHGKLGTIKGRPRRSP